MFPARNGRIPAAGKGHQEDISLENSRHEGQAAGG